MKNKKRLKLKQEVEVVLTAITLTCCVGVMVTYEVVDWASLMFMLVGSLAVLTMLVVALVGWIE